MSEGERLDGQLGHSMGCKVADHGIGDGLHATAEREQQP